MRHGLRRSARRLLARTLYALVTDQRARWAESGSDLLLTFLWQIPREQLPVEDMFAAAADLARTEATGDPSTCFGQPAIGRARAWMDKVALAHGLGRVMAPVHLADPVGVVRSLLGLGRFGRLDARLRGQTDAVLTQLDDAQWERLYVALGARKPAALAPVGSIPTWGRSRRAARRVRRRADACAAARHALTAGGVTGNTVMRGSCYWRAER